MSTVYWIRCNVIETGEYLREVHIRGSVTRNDVSKWDGHAPLSSLMYTGDGERRAWWIKADRILPGLFRPYGYSPESNSVMVHEADALRNCEPISPSGSGTSDPPESMHPGKHGADDVSLCGPNGGDNGGNLTRG